MRRWRGRIAVLAAVGVAASAVTELGQLHDLLAKAGKEDGDQHEGHARHDHGRRAGDHR
jgi:hypothetical protein